MLYGDVIIIKISWQTCLDWQSHCCSSWHYSSFNLHCGSEMFCSLVHLILILVEMLLMPQLKTLLPALLNLYVSRTVTSMTTLHLFSHWHAVFCHSEKCLSHVSRVTCHHSTSTEIGPNEQPWLLHLFSPSLCHINTCVTRRGAERNKWELVYYRVHFSRSKILWSISNNPGKTCQVEALATHPPLDRPFEHIMMDFSGLTPSKGEKNCLVIVKLWSKWVEAFPTAN